MIFRRIGTNEVDAIQICHGYVEAQQEYALQKHDGSEVNQYVQKIISTPGKQSGLACHLGRACRRRTGASLGAGLYGTPSALSQIFLQDLEGIGSRCAAWRFRGRGRDDRRIWTGCRSGRVQRDRCENVMKASFTRKNWGRILKIFKNMELYNPDLTWKKTDDSDPRKLLTLHLLGRHSRQWGSSDLRRRNPWPKKMSRPKRNP
jgi:hypothetical protein